MKSILSILALTLSAAACGGQADEDAAAEDAAAESPAAAASVTILAPAEASFQEEKDVTVWLRSTVPIVPAGDMTPGTGHHHLYLDADSAT